MSGHVVVTHVDGIPWYEAELPRRWHRCRPQTRGWLGLDQVERCACGAIRRNGRVWVMRNETRQQGGTR